MIGSFKKRIGPRGATWYGVVELPPDPVTGKRKQGRVSAPTKKACEEKARRLVTEADREGFVSSKITVREFLEWWLESRESSLRPSTLRRYRHLAQQHILPMIGNVQLGKLGIADIQRLHTNGRAAGLSPSSLYHMHYVLHGALEQAVRWELVSRNVVSLVPAPRKDKPDTVTWTSNEVRTFLSVSDGSNLAALWCLALLTGMRRGEILGLKWDDIDLDKGVLSVRRTRSRGADGKWEEGAPKTASGRRSIALPASVVQSLKSHRIAQLEQRVKLGPIWNDEGFVFTNQTGGPLHVNSLMGQFRRLTAAAGVPRIRFHDLRHTSATLMLENNEHPKIVQERLGHANIRITLDRYSHVTPSMQRDAAARLDALINPAS
jgi:integrase